MTTDTSGPAFPNAHFNNVHGMTLRDYFAAKAMQGLLAADTQFTMGYGGLAEMAFNQADAMLKAREL